MKRLILFFALAGIGTAAEGTRVASSVQNRAIQAANPPSAVRVLPYTGPPTIMGPRTSFPNRP